MRSTRSIEIIACHAEGEVGDVIVGGVAPPPGHTLWEQSRSIARDQTLRNFILNEPRGSVCRHINLLVPPKNPKAQMGFIIMEPEDTPPMSGSNSICVATVLLDAGIIPMTEPETRLTLEAPGGLIDIVAECSNGKAQRITIINVPSFVDRLDATLEVEGIGTLKVDTAYGGDSFVIVDAEALGFAVVPEEARSLAEIGIRITRAANDQLGFTHPTNPDWTHFSFCQIARQVEDRNGELTAVNAVAIQPGKIDRSPTGTGASARMAVLRAKGHMQVGDRYLARSIIGSEFLGRIEADTMIGDRPGIVPSISGRAWISGRRTEMLDPSDPWPQGYRLSDTWPRIGN